MRGSCPSPRIGRSCVYWSPGNTSSDCSSCGLEVCPASYGAADLLEYIETSLLRRFPGIRRWKARREDTWIGCLPCRNTAALSSQKRCAPLQSVSMSSSPGRNWWAILPLWSLSDAVFAGTAHFHKSACRTPDTCIVSYAGAGMFSSQKQVNLLFSAHDSRGFCLFFPRIVGMGALSWAFPGRYDALYLFPPPVLQWPLPIPSALLYYLYRAYWTSFRFGLGTYILKVLFFMLHCFFFWHERKALELFLQSSTPTFIIEPK